MAREELCSTDPTETSSNGKNKLLLLQQQTTEDQRIITVMSNEENHRRQFEFFQLSFEYFKIKASKLHLSIKTKQTALLVGRFSLAFFPREKMQVHRMILISPTMHYY